MINFKTILFTCMSSADSMVQNNNIKKSEGSFSLQTSFDAFYKKNVTTSLKLGIGRASDVD